MKYILVPLMMLFHFGCNLKDALHLNPNSPNQSVGSQSSGQWSIGAVNIAGSTATIGLLVGGVVVLVLVWWGLGWKKAMREVVTERLTKGSIRAKDNQFVRAGRRVAGKRLSR